MELIIKIDVESRAKAYLLVNYLSTQYKIKEATFDNVTEKFTKEKKPIDFLKSKNKEK